MKNKRKLGFRIWVLFSIVLFLLIPLLSSPVAAAFNHTSSVITTAGPGLFGFPTVTVTVPTGSPIQEQDQAPRTATFQLDYSFSDTTPTGVGSLGSTHKATMTVTRTPGPSPAPVTTNWIPLNPSTSTSGTLYINDTWTQAGSVNWDVEVIGLYKFKY